MFSVVVLAEALFHALAGFGREQRKGRRIKIRFLCSFGADCGSQQLQVLDVPNTPETDPEMKLDVDPLAQVTLTVSLQVGSRRSNHHLIECLILSYAFKVILVGCFFQEPGPLKTVAQV